MKTLIITLVSLMALMAISCEKSDTNIVPSPDITEREISITSFDQLEVSDALQVFIQFGSSSPTLRIETNDNLHSLFEIRQNDGSLSIELDDDFNQIDGSAVLNVFITTSDLESISGAGATSIFLEGQWSGDQITIDLTGASKLEGNTQNDRMEIDLSGACEVDLSGTSKEVHINATGASHLSSYALATDILDADLTGASSVSLTVNGTLSVKATGASMVYYMGDGVVKDQDLTGGSAIIKE